jgi:Uma2 family endonuclease
MDTARKPLSSRDFLAWAETQDKGKYELWRGEIVAMSPERLVHSYVKSEAGFALREAVRSAGLDCRVLIDGPAIIVDEETAFVPDIVVDCGMKFDRNAIVAPNPIIVVEVLSPGTRHIDKIAKLNAYAQVRSIAHYLIIDPDKRVVVHQRRQGENRFDTALLHAGHLRLDPPGVDIAVEQLLPE